MGILSNSAFSRSWMIRLSESFKEVDLPFASEIVLEKIVDIIRTESSLKISDIRFSLDSIIEKNYKTTVHGSHILGMGFTIRIVRISEYECKVLLMFCDKDLKRIEDIEKEFVALLKKREGIH
jgi:hypothetical protein